MSNFDIPPVFFYQIKEKEKYLVHFSLYACNISPGSGSAFGFWVGFGSVKKSRIRIYIARIWQKMNQMFFSLLHLVNKILVFILILLVRGRRRGGAEKNVLRKSIKSGWQKWIKQKSNANLDPFMKLDKWF